MSVHVFFDGSKGPIIYYQGTFDPFHNGHLSALEAGIEKTGADGAVVVVGDEPNPEKPNRSPIETRREMAYRMLSHFPKVIVSSLSQRETKQALFERHRVIALIGSDACHSYAHRPTSRFHQFCVAQRYSEEVFCHSTLAGKEVVCVTPSLQNACSSQIRRYLQSHPEIYRTFEPKSGAPLDQLNPAVQEFIFKNKIYLQDQKEAIVANSDLQATPFLITRLVNEIEQSIHKTVFPGKPSTCTLITNLSSKDKKESGRSGALTFLVVSREEKVFVKAHTSSTHMDDCEDEREGALLLSHLSLSWPRSLIPLDVHHCSEDSFLIAPFLATPDTEKIFKNAQDERGLQRLIHSCFCIGRSLSELHSCKSRSSDKNVILEETKTLNDRTFGRLKKMPSEREKQIRELFSSSYEEYLKNPGAHGYVHGDADLSNFIVAEEGTVTFLDIGRLILRTTKERDPLGCPAEDYYRFLEGLYWFNFWIDPKGILPLIVVTAAQDAFKRGYALFPSTITEEAHRYFSNYWKIKNGKFDPKLIEAVF